MATHNLFCLKPFCSVRCVLFKTDANLSRMMKASTFTTEFRRLIPRQFWRRLSSPFLWIEIISPSFQSLGILLIVQISVSSGLKTGATSSAPNFNKSRKMPSVPAALLSFKLLIATQICAIEGGSLSFSASPSSAVLSGHSQWFCHSAIC